MQPDAAIVIAGCWEGGKNTHGMVLAFLSTELTHLPSM